MVDNKIKERREELGISQDTLSKESGVSRSIISQLENKTQVNVTVNTMLALSSVLKQPVSNLFFF